MEIEEMKKFLVTPVVWINGTPSSYIYGRPYYEFNE